MRTKISAFVFMVMIAQSMHAQEFPLGTIDLNYSKSGRLMINIEAENLPDVIEYIPGQAMSLSYCINVLREIQYSSAERLLQSLAVDSSTVSHSHEGGRNGVYSISLRNELFSGTVNLPLDFDHEQIDITVTLSWLGATAEYFNQFGSACEYAGPILAVHHINLSIGEKTSLDLVLNE